jgi:hypothetical protein
MYTTVPNYQRCRYIILPASGCDDLCPSVSVLLFNKQLLRSVLMRCHSDVASFEAKEAKCTFSQQIVDLPTGERVTLDRPLAEKAPGVPEPPREGPFCDEGPKEG